MGSRGPAPTPTKILEARGSWRAKTRQGEPQLPVERPTCPEWLSAEARAEWDRQVPQLERMGILAVVDRAVLAAYCDTWSDFVRLAWQINELSGKWAVRTAVAGPDAEEAIFLDLQIGELERRKNVAAKRLIQLADRFGFSPAARARVKANGEEAPADDGKGRFFGTN